MLTVDGRCSAVACRNKDMYRMVAHCSNCGTKEILVLHTASHEARNKDCPVCHCWRSVHSDRVATDNEFPEASPVPAERTDAQRVEFLAALMCFAQSNEDRTMTKLRWTDNEEAGDFIELARAALAGTPDYSTALTGLRDSLSASPVAAERKGDRTVFGLMDIADPNEREALWDAYVKDVSGMHEPPPLAECARPVPTPQYVRGWVAALAWRAETASPVPVAEGANVSTVPTRQQVTDHVAQRLREARAGKDWSQDQLASACGWTQAAVSLYESARRRIGIHELCELAAALERPLSFFLDDLPSAVSPPQTTEGEKP